MFLGMFVFFISAIFFMWMAWSIRNGNINLIHKYHTKNIKEEDKKSYLEAFSLGMFVIAFAFLLSGLLLYLGKVKFVWISTFVGLIFGVFLIAYAQKKYNGSWFS